MALPSNTGAHSKIKSCYNCRRNCSSTEGAMYSAPNSGEQKRFLCKSCERNAKAAARKVP